jgi:hypothetical protein
MFNICKALGLTHNTKKKKGVGGAKIASYAEVEGRMH